MQSDRSKGHFAFSLGLGSMIGIAGCIAIIGTYIPATTQAILSTANSTLYFFGYGVLAVIMGFFAVMFLILTSIIAIAFSSILDIPPLLPACYVVSAFMAERDFDNIKLSPKEKNVCALFRVISYVLAALTLCMSAVISYTSCIILLMLGDKPLAYAVVVIILAIPMGYTHYSLWKILRACWYEVQEYLACHIIIKGNPQEKSNDCNRKG